MYETVGKDKRDRIYKLDEIREEVKEKYSHYLETCATIRLLKIA